MALDLNAIDVYMTKCGMPGNELYFSFKCSNLNTSQSFLQIVFCHDCAGLGNGAIKYQQWMTLECSKNKEISCHAILNQCALDN